MALKLIQGKQINVNLTGSFTGSFTGSLFGTSSNSISASYAATASYSRNLQISGSINNVDYIDFNTGSVVTQPIPGRLSWNDVDGTLDVGLKGGKVTLQIGQEEVARVVNKTANDLLEANYSVVRIRSVAEGGAQGGRLAVVLALADSDADSATTLGVVTEDIAKNQEGFITLSGQVRKINTTGALQGETWVDGDVLYLSSTIPGRLTNIKPTAPNHLVIVGFVEYAHNNQGKLFIKIDNGYELDELHNVLINTGSLTSGQLLVRSGSVWTNSNQLTGSYGITGSLTVTQGITGSLFGIATTASYVFTSSNDTNLVHKTGNETIDGIKTFSRDLIVNGIGVGRGGSITSVLMGNGALQNNTGGNSNVAIGSQALFTTTNASSLVAVGQGALYSNTIGSANTAIGTETLNLNTTGNNNTAVGRESLKANTVGFNNTANGRSSLLVNSVGNNNTALGYQSLASNTSGSGNVAIGANALSASTTANNNIAIGLNALQSNTIGGSNIAIGQGTSTLAITNTNSIVIGSGSRGLGSNTTVIGNPSTLSTAIYGDLLLGTTVDNGTDKLQVSGSVSIVGSLTQGAVGNIASGSFSHAEGENTLASGNASHAEGFGTVASGNYSHAEGLNTVASGDFQHVQGQFNISSSAQSAFIIGNGTSNLNRSNLIFASGSQVQITGSLDVSGSITAVSATTANQVVIKSQLDLKANDANVLHTTGDETKNGRLTVNDTAVGFGFGVKGTSINAIGVGGISTDYMGVLGESENSAGVFGKSTNGIGVQATSINGDAVQGESTNGTGVLGISTIRTGVLGVSTAGVGVNGVSTDYIGVLGESVNDTGVYAHSSNGYGVVGFSDTNTAGVFNTGLGTKIVSFLANSVEQAYISASGLFKANRILVNTEIDNGVDALQVDGTISATEATTANQVVIKSQLDTKQDTLTSGTNIKTINGTSVLGSGSLVVAASKQIIGFYPSWVFTTVNTWYSWNLNTSNILAANANQNLGVSTLTRTSFVDTNFIPCIGVSSLNSVTISVRGFLTTDTYEIYIASCLLPTNSVTGRGQEANYQVLVNQSFTAGAPSTFGTYNLTVANNTLNSNSGLFMAYRCTSNSSRIWQGVGLTLNFN